MQRQDCMGKARAAFQAMDRLCRLKIIGRATKIKIFNSNVNLWRQPYCMQMIWVLDNYTKHVRQIACLFQQMSTKDHKRTLAGQNIQQCIVEENWWRTGAGTARKKKVEMAWTHSGDLMTVLTSKHNSGHCKAAEEKGDPGTLGEEIWRRKCGWHASGTAGGRWKQAQDRAGWSLWPMLYLERQNISQVSQVLAIVNQIKFLVSCLFYFYLQLTKTTLLWLGWWLF